MPLSSSLSLPIAAANAAPEDVGKVADLDLGVAADVLALALLLPLALLPPLLSLMSFSFCANSTPVSVSWYFLGDPFL